MRSKSFGVILLTLLYTGSVHAFPISLVFAETKAACEAVGPCKKSGDNIQVSQTTTPPESNDDIGENPITDLGDGSNGLNDSNDNNDKSNSGKDELIDDLNEQIVDNGPDDFMPGDSDPVEQERDVHKQVAVPEPGAFALFGTGILALLLLRRRK